MSIVYLDNASTTRIDPRVLDAMLPYLKESYGNPSSIHSLGKSSKVLLEDTRDLIADFIGSKPKEIFFTSGGTEANNFALKGIAFASLNNRKKIISSSIEHLAVLETLSYLEKKFGFDISYLKPNKESVITPETIEKIIDKDTLLVTVMHSNNETGAINDIKAISELCSENQSYIHTDSIQSFGKVKFNVKELGINTATFSSHKIYGPKGIGALYIKESTLIDKFIHGGSQERDMRGGTENIPAIAGFKKAVELLKNEMEDDIRKYRSLKKILIQLLNEKLGDLVIINTPERSLPNILNISIDRSKIDFDEEMLLIKLDIMGIALSAGSACTSGTMQPSHVLMELGNDRKTAMSSLRISIGRFNDETDIIFFVEKIPEALNLL